MKTKGKIYLFLALIGYLYCLMSKSYPWLGVFSGIPIWLYLLWYAKNGHVTAPNLSAARRKRQIIGTCVVTVVVMLIELFRMI